MSINNRTDVENAIRDYLKVEGTLSIIDPLIFVGDYDHGYANILSEFIAAIAHKAESLDIYTTSVMTQPSIRVEVERRVRELCPNMRFKHSIANCPRGSFWINPVARRAVIIGSPFTEIGRRHMMYQEMDEHCINQILEYVNYRRI